ncbi:MAG: hypothetical protein FWE05_04095 [Defluviitaleaceae bacterium]|nr:hypothetical protein [Defluviitaleaceae bacterium]
MILSIDDKKTILKKLGATSDDMDALLEYTANAFSYSPKPSDDEYLTRWTPLLTTAKENGVAFAINQHLVRSDLQIPFNKPEEIEFEIYDSFAGKIPIITASSDTDFESLVLNIVHKGQPYPHIKKQGASFAFGKQNRFIILSHKPYSNLPAESIGLDDAIWRKKSLVLRKFHECAHYYTKQFHGSSQNNLHDELIADFCGMWESFSWYKADYFMKFLHQGRMQIYIENLSPAAAKVVETLAHLASTWIEDWSKSEDFLQLSNIQRIDFLCKKELLTYGG